MNKNYKFNSISLDVDDGVLENLFNIENSREICSLSSYPLKELTSHILYANHRVKEVILPETLETIIGDSITGCTSIEKINIPKSVKEITSGEYFLMNSELYRDENNWIGNCFVYDGWLLKLRDGDVVIPNNVKLASGTASYNSKITSIHFSDSIEEIPNEFVQYLSGVSKITFGINSKLKRINNLALYCPNLKEITIPASVEYIGNFAVDADLEKVYITNFKKFCEIERGSGSLGAASTNITLYLNNNVLKNITFPSDLTVLKAHTFYSTTIESLTIPKSVKEIGSSACNYCYSLKNINYQGTVAEWNAIIKPRRWAYQVPATYVQCTDGQVQL